MASVRGLPQLAIRADRIQRRSRNVLLSGLTEDLPMRRLALLMLATTLPAAAFAQDGGWTFAGVVGNYRLDAVSSPSIFSGARGALDPTLTLTLGSRYQVTTPGAAHPLAIISKGPNAAGDVVLLAQGADPGSLEADPGIAFVDAGNTISFTVTQTLVDAMNTGGRIPGYHCGNHPGTMRGNFTIAGPPPAPLLGAPAWLALALLLAATAWLVGARTRPAQPKW
jgi:hypothetical protein